MALSDLNKDGQQGKTVKKTFIFQHVLTWVTAEK